jgi:hypothetical protein
MSSSNGHAAVVVLPQHDVSHAFMPRNPDQSWGLCRICGFAESAHAATISTYIVHAPYRCPVCVETDQPVCGHSRPGEEQLS